jgi:hypothetical protein
LTWNNADKKEVDHKELQQQYIMVEALYSRRQQVDLFDLIRHVVYDRL